MKNAYYVVVILTIVIISQAACSKKENTSVSLPELVQAEAIMYEYPDNALQILQEMQMPAATQKLEHATWALLMTNARYKMFTKQNDSLINIAYDYFIKREDAQRKALVLYLKGGICHENQEVEKAQEYFLKAADYAEKIQDTQLCYLIYSQLGNIYVLRSINKYSLNYFNKTYHCAQELKNPRYIASSLIFLGRVYIKKGDYERAIECYKKAIKTAESSHNRDKIAHASNELAGVYLKIKDYVQALQYIKQALKTDKTKTIQGQIYLVFGKIYSETGKADSAYHYLNKLLSFEKYIPTTTDAYHTLYELSKKEKKYDKATFYSNKLLTNLDSIHRLDQSRVLAEMQEKYNQQKIINEKNQLKIEKDKNTRNALIGLVILICIIAALIYIYQRKLMKKEHAIQKKEEEIRKNTMKINDNDLIIRRNQMHMEELLAQIETNKDMQEQLEELSKTYIEIQQQNEVLAKENQVLQKNIEQYSFSLNAQSEELKKLNKLTEESRRLHDREKTLSNQLVKNSRSLNGLTTAPKYIDVMQWDDIEKEINTIFDNFTTRLSKRIPSCTEYDVHLCCLIKLSMNNANIAIALGISPASVSKQKFRLKERIIQQEGTFKESHTLDLWIWDF